MRVKLGTFFVEFTCSVAIVPEKFRKTFSPAVVGARAADVRPIAASDGLRRLSLLTIFDAIFDDREVKNRIIYRVLLSLSKPYCRRINNYSYISWASTAVRPMVKLCASRMIVSAFDLRIINKPVPDWFTPFSLNIHFSFILTNDYWRKTFQINHSSGVQFRKKKTQVCDEN